MFSSKQHPTRMICGFKVNTKSPGWHKIMTKILKKVKGGNFALDAEEGVAYVSGQGYLNKLLKLVGSKTNQDAEMAFVKTGHERHQPYDPCFYYNNNNGYYYNQVMPYGYWQPDLAYPYAPPQPVPYHLQYPYSGHCNYVYY